MPKEILRVSGTVYEIDEETGDIQISWAPDGQAVRRPRVTILRADVDRVIAELEKARRDWERAQPVPAGLERLRYDSGLSDGRANRPPREASRYYLRGYMEGRERRCLENWGLPKDEWR